MNQYLITKHKYYSFKSTLKDNIKQISKNVIQRNTLIHRVKIQSFNLLSSLF